MRHVVRSADKKGRLHLVRNAIGSFVVPAIKLIADAGDFASSVETINQENSVIVWRKSAVFV